MPASRYTRAVPGSAVFPHFRGLIRRLDSGRAAEARSQGRPAPRSRPPGVGTRIRRRCRAPGHRCEPLSARRTLARHASFDRGGAAGQLKPALVAQRIEHLTTDSFSILAVLSCETLITVSRLPAIIHPVGEVVISMHPTHRKYAQIVQICTPGRSLHHLLAATQNGGSVRISQRAPTV
jgi:hypothetical protein